MVELSSEGDGGVLVDRSHELEIPWSSWNGAHFADFALGSQGDTHAVLATDNRGQTQGVVFTSTDDGQTWSRDLFTDQRGCDGASIFRTLLDVSEPIIMAAECHNLPSHLVVFDGSNLRDNGPIFSDAQRYEEYCRSGSFVVRSYSDENYEMTSVFTSEDLQSWSPVTEDATGLRADSAVIDCGPNFFVADLGIQGALVFDSSGEEVSRPFEVPFVNVDVSRDSIISWEDYSVSVSRDYGETWSSPISSPFDQYSIYAVSGDGHIWAVSEDGEIATTATVDGGVESTTNSDATLGVAWYPDLQGWGEVEPTSINSGGSSGGLVDDIIWESWGDEEATGSGTGYYVDPGDFGADSYAQPVEIVASDLGDCDGQLAYRLVQWYFPTKGESRGDGSNWDAEMICRGP